MTLSFNEGVARLIEGESQKLAAALQNEIQAHVDAVEPADESIRISLALNAVILVLSPLLAERPRFKKPFIAMLKKHVVAARDARADQATGKRA